jgi:hypothetical protein
MRLIIVLLLLCGIATACKKKCAGPDIKNSSELKLQFNYKLLHTELYSEFSPLYNKDSLKIFDENGNKLRLKATLSTGQNASFWLFSFSNIYTADTDARAFDKSQIVCKKYFVQYKYNDRDTIEVCFNAVTTVCGNVFDPLTVYYKNEPIGSVSGETVIQVAVVRK